MKATLTAQILQVYKAPAGKTKEGADYGGDWRVTVMAPQVLQDGQEIIQPHEMRLGEDDAAVAPWKALVGQKGTFEVDFFAGKNGLGFRMVSAPKAGGEGSQPPAAAAEAVRRHSGPVVIQ